MGEGNTQQIDNNENKTSWLKKAWLVLWLAGAINGADMNKQDVESTVDTTRTALSSLISTSTANAGTLDWNKIVINQDIETVDSSIDITKNEALNEVLKWLNLDEVTNNKVLDNLKKVSSNEVLWAITTIPATGWSIEIQKDWEDMIILVDKWWASEWKDWNKLEINIKDPKKSLNSPIIMSSNWVTYEIKKEGTMFLAWAVVSGEREAARVWVTSKVSEKVALWLMADLWPDLYRIIASIWLEVWDNWQLIFMWEHLTQTQDVSTQLMWILEEKISQNKLWFEYKQKLGEWFVEYLVLRWYVSKADSKELLSREFQTEDANFIRIYRQILSIEWGTWAWLEGWVWFKLNKNNKIEITIDADSLDFGDLWKETWIWVNTRFTSESLAHWIRVYLEWWVGNEVKWNMVWAGASIPLENLWIKTSIEDLRARVWVLHTMGWIWEDNTTAFVWLTWRFGWDKKIDDVTRNNLEKWNRLTRDIEGSTQKPTWRLTEDMMTSIERFATKWDIKVKVGEKTELVSETEKPKPVVEKPKDKPKKPENKDILEANDDSFSTNKNTTINWMDVLGNDTEWAKLTWNLKGQVWWTFTVNSWKINFDPTNNFTWTASAEYEVELNWKTDWAKIVVEVKWWNTPPETQTPPKLSDIPNKSATNWTAFSWDISWYAQKTNWDAITGYVLTWTLPTWVTFDSATWKFSWTPTQNWTFNLSVIAKDNDWNSNSDSFTLTVDNTPTPDTPPTMWNVPDTTVTVGNSVSVNVSNYVTQTNWDSISTYTLTWSLPAWVSFNSTSWLLSWTPTETWTFNLSVTATDNDWVSWSDNFTVTVEAVADTVAPSKTWESFPNLDTINSAFSWTMSFDENVASVTSISISGGGSLSVTGWLGTSTLNISWTTWNFAWPTQIEITVEDSSGNSRTINSNSYDVM